MSIERTAVLGAIWNISTSVGARLIGLVGTLVLTRFLSKEVFGEVAVAQVAVLTADAFGSIGVGNYVVAHPKADRATVFHATVLTVSACLIALVVVVALRGPLGPWMGASTMGVFVPGLALSVLLSRIGGVPERLLVRDLRFRLASVQRGLGDVVYAVVSVALAAVGWGGMSVVAASIARSTLRMIICIGAMERRAWLEVHPLRASRFKEILGFSLPMTAASWAAFVSWQWDNVLVARLYGPAVAGGYKLAYNLAELPAVHIGEHIGDVLLPSFAHMEEKQRRGALTRAIVLLALLVFPIATGLGVVAATLVGVLLAPEWQSIAPLLTILSALSVTRPVGWIVGAYLQAERRTRPIAVLEVGKTAMVLGTIMTIGRLGPAWACVAVGIAFAAHALASLFVVRSTSQISIGRVLLDLARPLLACGVMAGAVLAVRSGLGGVAGVPKWAALAAEVLTGGLTYVPAAFLLSPAASRDMLGLLRRALRR